MKYCSIFVTVLVGYIILVAAAPTSNSLYASTTTAETRQPPVRRLIDRCKRAYNDFCLPTKEEWEEAGQELALVPPRVPPEDSPREELLEYSNLEYKHATKYIEYMRSLGKAMSLRGVKVPASPSKPRNPPRPDATAPELQAYIFGAELEWFMWCAEITKIAMKKGYLREKRG